jgi:hypothetical protein
MERRSDERQPLDPLNQRDGESELSPRQSPPGEAASSHDHPDSPRYTEPHVDHPHHRADFPSDEPLNPRSESVRGRPRRVAPDDMRSIRPRPGTIGATGPTSQRDEVDKITPGPGHTEEVDAQVRERMDEDSPDGSPPGLADRRNSRTIFFATLIVVWVVVISAVGYVGGLEMAALVLLLTAIYIGYASWPVWRAALERRGDERQAEREIEIENNPDAPADRQPPAQNR